MNINYFMPTRIIMGEGCILQNSSIFSSLGKKALIVTGKNSAKINGSLDDVISALKKENIGYCIFDRVMSNPTVDCVYDGAKQARGNDCDFVIAIGGGSPMDAAKAIAMLAKQDIPKENIFSRTHTEDVLPMILVPTTAGTGSEVTPYSILTNDTLQTKMSIASPQFFPKTAFLDAEYTKNLPHDITVNTAIDALSHAIEGMLSLKSNAISDYLAGESIRLISSTFDELTIENISFQTREKLLYASALAGMVIANTGTVAVHAMGYPLTYFKNIDHGRANGLVIGEFIKVLAEKNSIKAQEILSLMGFSSADELISKLFELFGERETLTFEEINLFTDKTMSAKNINNCIEKFSREDVFGIFSRSFIEK